MGLKSTFEKALEKNKIQLEGELRKTKTFLATQNLSLKESHQSIVTSLSLIFLKMSLIDREVSESEINEVKKRLSRFLEMGEAQLMTLLHASKIDLSGVQGRKPDIPAAAVAYLSKRANTKTKQRIFRYLINIVSADKKIETEEKYLLEITGATFGLKEKEVREYLLAAELQTSLEELEVKDPWVDSYKSENPPTEDIVIHLDLD